MQYSEGWHDAEPRALTMKWDSGLKGRHRECMCVTSDSSSDSAHLQTQQPNPSMTGETSAHYSDLRGLRAARSMPQRSRLLCFLRTGSTTRDLIKP